VLRAFCAFGDMFNRGGRLSARSREVAILRTAWRTGASYEAAYHLDRARQTGLRDERLGQLELPGTSGLEPDDALWSG
jgi:4-carboxymuconolactone decarboxylase